jgi:hypothetical protein
MREGMTDIVILLLSLIAGGCGYLVVTFWMQPILRYLDIRHEVTSDLIFYANVIDPKWVNDRLKERHEAGSEAHRKHAAEIAACFYRLPSWYRAILKKRGEDPLTASKNLIGLSNCSSSSDADPHIQWLKKSLCIAPELDL